MVSKRKFERKVKELITREKGSVGKSQALAVGATIATIAVLEAQIVEAGCDSSSSTGGLPGWTGGQTSGTTATGQSWSYDPSAPGTGFVYGS